MSHDQVILQSDGKTPSSELTNSVSTNSVSSPTNPVSSPTNSVSSPNPVSSNPVTVSSTTKVKKSRKKKENRRKKELDQLRSEVSELRALLESFIKKSIVDQEKIDIQKKEDIRLISGSSHTKLAAMIADELDIPLTKCKITKFANTETRIQLEESVRGKHVYFLQSGGFDSDKNLSVNDYIMEMVLILDAVAGSAKSITLFIPCFPYARQDKKDAPRAAISARTISQILSANGNLKRVVCVDLHAGSIQGLFPANIACDNLYCIRPICDYLYENVFKSRDHNEYGCKFVAISPDAGALKRVSEYASKLNLKHMQMSKQRDYSKNNVVDEIVLLGNPKWLTGNTAIIFDDMIDTGGTIIKAVECLVEKGAKDAIIVVSHGILSGAAIDRINQCQSITSVIVSDSLPQEKNMEKCSKLKTFTVSKMYAEVVNRIIHSQSISDMFYTKELND